MAEMGFTQVNTEGKFIEVKIMNNKYVIYDKNWGVMELPISGGKGREIDKMPEEAVHFITGLYYQAHKGNAVDYPEGGIFGYILFGLNYTHSYIVAYPVSGRPRIYLTNKGFSENREKLDNRIRRELVQYYYNTPEEDREDWFPEWEVERILKIESELKESF